MISKLFSNTLLLALACFLLHSHGVLGHTYLSSVQLAGTDLAEGDCVRPHPAFFKENPILSVLDNNMTLGWLPEANEPANRNCPVTAGETIGIQWHHIDDSPTDDIIATTHKGPCLVYLAKSSTGAGPVWFKIWEDGYDATTQQWCVDTLLANKGLFTFTIPPNIAPGDYLLRAEILALHGANVLNGVQPYVGAVQITISGSGTASPPANSLVSIPGCYQPTDPGMLFNIYVPFNSYTIPGPAVWDGSGGSSPTPATSAPATSAPATSSPATASPTSSRGTSAPATSSPATSAPATSSPATTQPTQKATSRPSRAPTPTPNSPPSTTSSPTSSSSSSSSSSSTVRVQLYPSSSEWWLAVTTRSTPDVASIKLQDSGSYNTWTALQTTNWGYWTFPATQALTLPISLMLTATTGEELILTDIFTSYTTTAFVDTGKTFTSTAPAPATQAPTQPDTDAPTTQQATPATTTTTTTTTQQATPATTTQQPTAAPVQPTPGPTSSPVKNMVLDVHVGSSVWWFAAKLLQVADGVNIHDVSVTDSGPFRTLQPLSLTSWGYWMYSTTGSALIAPLHFKVTSDSGDVVTFTIPSITPDTDYDTGVQLSS